MTQSIFTKAHGRKGQYIIIEGLWYEITPKIPTGWGVLDGVNGRVTYGAFVPKTCDLCHTGVNPTNCSCCGNSFCSNCSEGEDALCPFCHK